MLECWAVVPAASAVVYPPQWAAALRPVCTNSPINTSTFNYTHSQIFQANCTKIFMLYSVKKIFENQLQISSTSSSEGRKSFDQIGKVLEGGLEDG